MSVSEGRTGLMRRSMLRIASVVLGIGVVALMGMIGTSKTVVKAKPAMHTAPDRVTVQPISAEEEPEPRPDAGGDSTEEAGGDSTEEQERLRIAERIRNAGVTPVRKARHGRGKALACPETSVICQENALPGNPASEWQITGAGDSNIQGYGTTMSVAPGETVHFKVNTTSTNYRADIYRIGYYNGMGARKVATITPSVTLPQTQPACATDSTTGLIDCGNWAESASWAVPADAVSGVYIAKLVRQDATAGTSHMIFIVRDDTRGSDLLFKTSDTSWQAYNAYGGNSLYAGSPVGRAYKVSYNRPFTTACCSCCAGEKNTWFFNAEYSMVRWLEANGYDVSYTSSIDTATSGNELLEHKVFLAVGHDEYWSNEMRDNVHNAAANGVNQAFLSGNEVFWKTRWENSVAGPSTSFRTLVCYKETHANAKIDPSAQWTGTWRDPRFSPPSDGGRPENALTGTLFMVNGGLNIADQITVPAEYGPMRLWRDTAVAALAPGEVATFPHGTLGFEWDEAPDNGFAPDGLVKFSQTTATVPSYLQDFGSTYATGVATHNLTLYRNPSGALIFGAGTIQWSWGLDSAHQGASTPTDINMQQATVNLLADMGAQPASIQPGLVPATASTDTQPPTSVITSPSDGASVESGQTLTIQGTADDTGGGVVAGVEISLDGGTQWHPATGRTNWSYDWAPPSTPGNMTIKVRAIDDIGNIQSTPTSVTVNVVRHCPCSIWESTTVPGIASTGDTGSVEIGVKFQVANAGYIRGIRFYKGSANVGTHVGNLWSASGQLLATATFTAETAAGWQQVDFPVPVPVSANTTYVASYFAPNGRYALNLSYFTSQVVNGPLTALASGASGGNGVYAYGSSSIFPSSTYQSANYWVDVAFTPFNTVWDNTATPAVTSPPDTDAVVVGTKFRAATTGTIRGVRFYKGVQNTGTHVGSLWTTGGQLLASVTFSNESAVGWQEAYFNSPVSVSAGTTYVVSYKTVTGHFSYTLQYFNSQYANYPLFALADGDDGGNGVYAYSSANTFPSNTYQATNYWTDVVFAPSSSVWDDTATPAVLSPPAPEAVVLGMKFRATTDGMARGVRFYKGTGNTGTHVGSLWTTGGQLLASVTFSGESASGWQQAYFNSPVPVSAGTTYVVSYHTTTGHFSYTLPYFVGQQVNYPLIALADGADGGNGVYAYSSTNVFPSNTYQSANYWVDVLFDVG
ncbi:DUF4082 domain-containing protein [Streptosporangium sp. NPDC051023]|uniref:DUF4082 domain-containing protein n=1 Tax=Streptosporangium sp. NPDC051023 TaxID=3155410 RepID=UPI00344F58CF